MNDFLITRLADLTARDLRRRSREIEGAQGVVIRWQGRTYLNFSSNNYLGLADDPRLIAAARAAMDREGFGAGASRLVCGNMESHRRLEDRMARLKKTERCLCYSTGYMANVGMIPALFGRDDVIFSDRLNHASIIDGIRLSGAKMIRYRHRDPNHLRESLRAHAGARHKAVVTDTVFSMDGDLAPLREIADAAGEAGAMLIVDEAHGFGVFGKEGLGLTEELGLTERVDIQMGTFSKAAGSFGAYVCASEPVVETLINTSRSFIYTTGLPPSVAAASLAGVEAIVSDPDRRADLLRKAAWLRKGISGMGFSTGDSLSPIIPVIVGEDADALRLSGKLMDRGIFVPAIRPPTVPAGTARLRITVTSAHSEEQLNTLLEVLETAGRK